MRISPTAGLEDRTKELIASDTLMLADGDDAPTVFLVIAPFTPSRAVAKADLVLATFTGSAAKASEAGTQQAYFDPLTQEQVVQLAEPEGGWMWECTAAPAETETVYGIVVCKGATATTMGSGLLDEPVPISAIGDGVNIGSVQLRLPLGAFNQDGSPE